MPTARCAVSFTDSDGIIHEARVQAESLYEAVALAIADFRQDKLIPVLPASSTEFTVAIEPPRIEHRIRLSQIEKWARSNTTCEGPAGIAKRQRIRTLLGNVQPQQRNLLLLHRCYHSGNIRVFMSDRSKIEWTDATWNPLRGCTKISPGCKHCYAETFAERFRGVPGHPYEQGFDLRLVPEKLSEPFNWSSSSASTA